MVATTTPVLLFPPLLGLHRVPFLLALPAALVGVTVFQLLYGEFQNVGVFSVERKWHLLEQL